MNRDQEGKMRSSVALAIGSNSYVEENRDSDYAIAPWANYHGFFNNTIEIRCYLKASEPDEKTKKEGGLGITITAMDHSVIEEDGGRTKTIPLDADDDEGNL